MEATVWMCLILLCLKGSLFQLTQGADCSGTSQGEDCVPTRQGMNDVSIRPRPSPQKNRVLTKPQSGKSGVYSAIGLSVDDDNTPSDIPLDRQKRQLGKHGRLTGSISAKGFPNTLIQQVQTDQARRHLGQSGTKKKNKRKSRVGSFSLLRLEPTASLKVTRVGRQLQNKKKKGGGRPRPGAYTILGDPEQPPLGQRLKRSAQKKKQSKRRVCS